MWIRIYQGWTSDNQWFQKDIVDAQYVDFCIHLWLGSFASCSNGCQRWLISVHQCQLQIPQHCLTTPEVLIPRFLAEKVNKNASIIGFMSGRVLEFHSYFCILVYRICFLSLYFCIWRGGPIGPLQSLQYEIGARRPLWTSSWYEIWPCYVSVMLFSWFALIPIFGTCRRTGSKII